MSNVLGLVELRGLSGGATSDLEDNVIKVAQARQFLSRRRTGRLVLAAALAALLAVPATAAASQASVTANRAASASCPWVTSQAPIAQRVAQLMSQMSLADKIT